MVHQTSLHLEEFGAAGLRTLCCAFRTISSGEYEQWLVRYRAAAASLTGRQEALDAAAEDVEKELMLLGCTAIEDKLQAGVPECISKLHKAGINLWVLTGDKQETAVNIG